MQSYTSISAIFSSGLCGLGLTLCPYSAAFAADVKPYVEIGPGLIDGEILEDSQHVSGLARAGIEVASWAAFEVEGIIGLDKAEEIQSDGDEFRAGVNHQFGGYLRLGVPIEKKILPYVRVGFASAQTEVTRRRTRDGETEVETTTDTFSGVSFGAGIQGTFGENNENGVRLDFIGLLADGDESEFFDLFDGTSNFSLTYVRRF